MGSLLEATIMHHVGIVLVVLWMLNSFNCCGPVVYFIAFVYLFIVHEGYVTKLRKTLQFEESRNSNQRRVLSDSETVRWLNHAVEKMWTVCMEEIVSQKILLPIVPWFLEKYKPWTVKEAVVQQLYLGRCPPIFTEMRVLRQSNDDDHLVLELGMNFRTADDMNALLAVKLRKMLGLGMWAKLHLLGMHIEGKVLIGVKFLRKWPFIGRLRLCFVEPPYFQMTVKPIFTHGLDVTELPGIAGWLDNLLAVAFEQTLVEPNMLVVDVEKFVSPQPETWFSVDEKEPLARAVVEVLEAADLKPSDLNGLADPYVKGQLGPYRFRTKTQKKTLAPKWNDEFRVPICSWDSPNLLTIEVRDKDPFVDDKLGECSVNITELRDGQRHDMWISLQNIKVGRLHLAITVVEGKPKETAQACDGETFNEYKKESFATDATNKGSFSSASSEKSPRVADKYEPIDVKGQQETGIWVHHPGSEVAQVWEPRKGKSRIRDTRIREESLKSKATESFNSNGSSTAADTEKTQSRNLVQRGFQKLGSMFRRRQRNEEFSCAEEPVPSPRINLKSVNSKEIGVKFIVDEIVAAEALAAAPAKSPAPSGNERLEGCGPESSLKVNVKGMSKNVMNQAGKSARFLKLALSKKDRRKSKSESGELEPERDASVESDSDCSAEESISSSVDAGVEATTIAPNPVSGDSRDIKSCELRTLSPSSDGVDTDGAVKRTCIEVPKTDGDNALGGYERDGAVGALRTPKLPDTSLVLDK